MANCSAASIRAISQAMRAARIWPFGAEWVVLVSALVGLAADALTAYIAVGARSGTLPPSGPSGSGGLFLLVAWVVPFVAALLLAGWRRRGRRSLSKGAGPSLGRATRIALIFHAVSLAVLFAALMAA